MRRKGGAFVLITRTRCSLKLSPFRYAVTCGELRGFKVNHKPDRQEQPKENLMPGVTAYAFRRAEYHSLVSADRYAGYKWSGRNGLFVTEPGPPSGGDVPRQPNPPMRSNCPPIRERPTLGHEPVASNGHGYLWLSPNQG